MSKLPLLEHRIKPRTQQVKDNIRPNHTETLDIEIETLRCDLKEILE